MQNKELKAKVKATGKTISVYKLNNGNWCDAFNCTDQYKSDELIFL